MAAATTTRRRTTAAPKTRTILVEQNGQNGLPKMFRLTLPAKARITYGNLHPGSKVGYRDNPGDANVLRVYEGTVQTAIFRGVLAFRDEAYPYEAEELVVSTKSEQQVLDGRVLADAVERAVRAQFRSLPPGSNGIGF